MTVTSPADQTSVTGTVITPLQMTATDSASGQTLTYAASGLPAGLTISTTTGLITGTPTTAGTSTATVATAIDLPARPDPPPSPGQSTRPSAP